MNLAKMAGCVIFCFGCCSAQELGLRDYLQRLNTAPGASIDQKVDWLSNSGVTLSPAGLRELESTAKKSAFSATTPYNTGLPSHLSPVQPYTPAIQNTIPFSGTASRVGSNTYYNWSDGTTGTSSRVGNHEYSNFSNGMIGTSSQVGRFTYENWNNGVTGTANRVGNYKYFNWSDGTSATQTRIGNQTYTNFSNGKICTTQNIGSHSYTNCN